MRSGVASGLLSGLLNETSTTKLQFGVLADRAQRVKEASAVIWVKVNPG